MLPGLLQSRHSHQFGRFIKTLVATCAVSTGLSYSVAAQQQDTKPTVIAHDSTKASVTNPDISDQGSVIIAGTILPYFFHPKEKGMYNNIYNMIMVGIRKKPDLVYLPVRRASKMFMSQAADCFFIANRKRNINKNLPENSPKIIYSRTIHKSQKKVYSLKSDTRYNNFESLKGKKIVADAGAGSPKVLYEVVPKTATILRTESVERSIDMLLAGRADAVIAYQLDMDTYLSRHPTENKIQFNPNFNVQSGESAIACWDTPRTQDFMTELNRRISFLYENDALSDQSYKKLKMLSAPFK